MDGGYGEGAGEGLKISCSGDSRRVGLFCSAGGLSLFIDDKAEVPEFARDDADTDFGTLLSVSDGVLEWLSLTATSSSPVSRGRETWSKLSISRASWFQQVQVFKSDSESHGIKRIGRDVEEGGDVIHVPACRSRDLCKSNLDIAN